MPPRERRVPLTVAVEVSPAREHPRRGVAHDLVRIRGFRPNGSSESAVDRQGNLGRALLYHPASVWEPPCLCRGPQSLPLTWRWPAWPFVMVGWRIKAGMVRPPSQYRCTALGWRGSRGFLREPRWCRCPGQYGGQPPPCRDRLRRRIDGGDNQFALALNRVGGVGTSADRVGGSRAMRNRSTKHSDGLVAVPESAEPGSTPHCFANAAFVCVQAVMDQRCRGAAARPSRSWRFLR